jgi:hypothetical protein
MASAGGTVAAVGHDRDEWATPLPRRPADLARALVPALLLAVIAAIGVRNHIDHDQSSWEGASFGMFATYENHVSRVVVVSVDGPDGRFQASLPSELRDDALRLRVAPSQGAIDRLADDVADLVRGDGATSVTVELRRLQLDNRDGRLEARYETALDAEVEP